MSGFIAMGANMDWGVMYSSVPVGVRPLTSSSYHEHFKHNLLLIGLQQAHHTQRLHSPSCTQSIIAPLLHNGFRLAGSHVTVNLKSSTCQTTWVHVTAVVSYGGGERWRWSERRRERKKREAVSNHGSRFFFLCFSPPVKSPSDFTGGEKPICIC